MAEGTEVILRAHAELPEIARERWTADDVKTIAATVCHGLNVGELKMVLSIGAKYDLDPLLKEIWGSRGRTRDGSPGKLLIMVGRDGLLKNAERSEGYHGFDWGEVRENDYFKVVRGASGVRTVEHSYEGGAEARGALVGAWAEVYRLERHPVFYFANWAEYVPDNPNPRSSWSTNPTLMILKCALSHALRVAFTISGVTSEEESARYFESDGTPTSSIEDVVDAVPEKYRDWLRRVYSDADDLRPGEMTPSAVEMNIRSQPDEIVERYLSAEMTVNEALAKRREEEEPPEAEVVPDAEPLDEGQTPRDAVSASPEAEKPRDASPAP